MKDVGAQYDAWADRGVGQKYVHASDVRFRSVMAGRQSGKSFTGIAEICIDAMEAGDTCERVHTDDKGKPVRCSGHINWWIAPNYRVKDRPWRGLIAFLPPEVVAKKNENELRIRLTNGSEIFIKSADAPDSLVSEGLHFAVCDEAGQWKETAWTMGVRPMFTATKGRALLIGTPRGKNWFHRLWLLGWGKNKCSQCEKDPAKCSSHDPDYESFHWKTEDSPYSDPKDLAEAKKNLPRDIYAQEYDADPLDSSGGVFKHVRDRVSTFPFKSDQFTVIGLDLARAVDFTALIPMNSARQALYCKRTQDDWPLQQALVVSEVMSNSFARILADQAGPGDVFVSNLRQVGISVEGIQTSSAPIKRALIDTLRLAFEQGTISIPDDPTLIDELESYTYEILPSGGLRYSAPQGEHDDTVIALALAYWGQRFSSAQVVNKPKKDPVYTRSKDGLRTAKQWRYVA